MNSFTIIRDTELPAKKVWNILSDFTRSLASAFTVKVEKKGESLTNGIGTVRILNIGKRQFRERLESVEPPNLFTYQLLSGAPVKEYFGTVDVQSRNSTALINWNVKFTPKIIGTGWIIKAIS